MLLICIIRLIRRKKRKRGSRIIEKVEKGKDNRIVMIIRTTTLQRC